MDSLIQNKAVIVGLVFASLFILERMMSAARQPHHTDRLISNIALWMINFPVSLFYVVPVAAYAAAHGLWDRPAFLTGLPGLVLDLLILDFWLYWMHRAYHEVPFLWRFHQVHHLDQQLDTTSAVRFHFAEVMISASIRCVLVVLLAMPLSSVLVFETILLAGTIFHHSNIKLPKGLERALSQLIVTPSIHWVHHHAVREDTDSNYASGLSVWDRVFGTRSKTARDLTMKIGVENQRDISLLGLIVRPFKRDNNGR